MRRVDSIEQIEELIQGHFGQLQSTLSVLDFIKKGADILESENVKTDFVSTESNIKYFCFLTSSFLDLLTTLKGFMNSKTEWENIYFSKISFLTIYETISTYHEYQISIKPIVNSDHPHLLEPYKKTNEILKAFKKDYGYEKVIAPLRNKAAGHYHKDFIEYYEQIKSLDREISIRATEDFLDFLKILMHFTYVMADETEERTRKMAEASKQEFLKKMKDIDDILNNKK